MTLIAALKINKVPVILGDLLLSIESSEIHSEVSVPTADLLNNYLRGNSHVRAIGMRQKVNLIGKDICIAWSGSYIQARSLITTIKEKSQYRDLGIKDFEYLLDSYPKSDMSGVKIITYFGNDYCCSNRSFNAPLFTLDGIEDVQVAGTGTSVFIQSIESAMNDGRISKSCPSLGEAVGKILGFTSTLFSAQAIAGYGLLDAWGGGFEIAYIGANGFRKLNNILYLFWRVRRKSDGSIEAASNPFFVKSDYLGDVLRIFVCDWSSQAQNHKIYLVDPMYRSEVNNAIELPPLTYKWLVNTFICEENGKFQNRVDYFGSGNLPIGIQIHEDRYEVLFRNQYFETILRELKMRF